jgi:hypothetical protein
MATTGELEDLYLQRLDKLERQIKRQRKVLVDHENRQRNIRSWQEIQQRHALKAEALAHHRHVIQEMIEDLRFDVDVLVQDFRRFFASSDTNEPRTSRRQK